jgi:inorganic phosphate transporter, PiT family
MASAFTLLLAVVLLAVVFDYINGFHDTANAVATVVSTNVLPARVAVMMAAAFNFAGALFATGVAKTISSGIVPYEVPQTVIAATLVGAILWNLLTWYFGIPSSSSHALVGGMIGAACCYAVLDRGEGLFGSLGTLLTSEGVVKTLKGIVLSPLFGFGGGFLLMLGLLWLTRKASPYAVSRTFRPMQLFSAGFMAWSHGANDAQKAMGVITLALVSYQALPEQPVALPQWMEAKPEAAKVEAAAPQASAEKKPAAKPKKPSYPPPKWVVLTCALAMGLGTAAGGYRIMKTMGHKIIKLKPIHGFAAETSAATVISIATHFGVPVSTTHAIASSIMGVGASKRVSAVRWGVAKNMVAAWILTIPISSLVAALVYALLRLGFPAAGK